MKLWSAQLSVAVGTVHVAVCEHDVAPTPVFAVTFDGHPAMTGGVLSITVTVNEQVDVLPDESFAV